jgi:uncharacterized integral membrane protein (TIGR00698 family)
MFGLKKDIFSGVFFVAIFAIVATLIANTDFVKKLGFSSLVIGIVLGIIYANLLHHKTPNILQSGITFSAKKILRLGIILYGFRLTFQEIINVGSEGFFSSLIMLTSTFLIGVFFAIKIFKIDKDTAILTASGASICGAAAVLATESVLKAKEYKTAVAVSMVVLFGTISMFLYPIIYETLIKNPDSFFYLTPSAFGIYIGSSVHEVAQVVAIPASIPNSPEVMANNAVIVKMTRVILIAPFLIVLGFFLAKKSNLKSKTKLVIPWFAIYFILVAAFNSLNLIPKNIVEIINLIDTFLLTMAMSALGMGTIFKNFKSVGTKAFLTAFIMFLWLIFGGFFIVKLITF